MSLDNVTPGKNAPHEFNVIIEIPMNADPIKYEVDKETGAIFVDRFMSTSMHYPTNYGYVPKTLSGDGDPVDVLRVSAQIVELQKEFIEHGIERLRPMVLRDVAEATGFHESTISRVVKAKTIHTPQGLFDLNYFFSARPKDSDVSATVVKHRIKAFVQAEDIAKPLSDEAIASLLERDGIKVARRTVNKYREELKIPPASQRRRR